MQTLKVEINIPPDYVVIPQQEYLNLKTNDLVGKQWSIGDLKEHTNRSTDWLKENILYPYRDELDVLNGGFVKYPESKGQPWRFGAKRMSEWLEENLKEVL